MGPPSRRLPDDRLTHACALAYLSDIGSGFHRPETGGLGASGPSLDHAMWFRAPIRADEWLLSAMSPLHAGGAWGLFIGSLFHRDSTTLGVTFTQEALLRPADTAVSRVP